MACVRSCVGYGYGCQLGIYRFGTVNRDGGTRLLNPLDLNEYQLLQFPLIGYNRKKPISGLTQVLLKSISKITNRKKAK